MVKNQKRIEQIAGLSVIIAIFLGCGFVLKPFILSILWAAILCFATWPLYELLLKWLKGRRNLAAALMTLILILVLFIPLFMVGVTFTDGVQSVIEWISSQDKESLQTPPEWINKIPWVGTKLNSYWTDIAQDTAPAIDWLKPQLKKAGLWLLQHSLDVARGVFYIAMSVLFAFFLYRDGQGVVKQIRDGFQKISGDYSQHLMEIVKTTTRSVVYGVIGTALAQGIVAWIGFSIAGLPSPMILAMFTFFLSFIPIGPPVIWIGASIWLFVGGKTGWGIFMVIYGILAISSVDNVIKPYIISKGSKLPFIVMFIGVLGGIATFGFIGVFLGPTLLAVGYSLAKEILINRTSNADLKKKAKQKNTDNPAEV